MSGGDDCSMNHDVDADGSTSSPPCKRKPVQSSEDGATWGATSTATTMKQSSQRFTCVFGGPTSGRSRPLRDWHRALFAILLGEWHCTLDYPGSLSDARRKMLDRSGFKESIEEILIAVPEEEARPRKSNNDVHTIASGFVEKAEALCRRSGTQKGPAAAQRTKELLGPFLLRMGAARRRRGRVAMNTMITTMIIIIIIISMIMQPADSAKYYPNPAHWQECEFYTAQLAWDATPHWTNNGNNSIAVAFVGTVSPRSAQAQTVEGLRSTGDPNEFVALGPSARHFEKFVLEPNNFEIDTFLFSWAPTAALRKELLLLYRPFASRFEEQAAWLPVFARAIELCRDLWPMKKDKQSNDIAPTHFRMSLLVSIHLALNLVRTNEQLRSRRYDRVVVFRPDAVIKSEVQLAFWPTDLANFHNNGNWNTGDILFIVGYTIKL